ncbi:MAG: L-aspartate oxidase [Clostridiales Family XIII bacterium]|jgi:L-aspartate oxidase|nr:L-aspartate oxidase [Clostridiales Family XIII bacterium]
MDFDVIIAGSGAAGLFCALHIDPGLRILIVTKSDVRECNSYLAQGGITMVLDEEDKPLFIEDTMRAGRGENDERALTMVAEHSGGVIAELIAMGVPFTEENGRLHYTREGAHSKNRIVHAKDETGKYLIETLLTHIAERKNITVREHTTLVDIMEEEGGQARACVGAVISAPEEGRLIKLTCRATVLACGGIGGLFRNTTNQPTVTGDSIAIAFRHGVELKRLDYIQFHPTALYEPSAPAGRRFLISESLRGEGAYLLNCDKRRFVDEMSPRDAVTRAILYELDKNPRVPFVYLDISHKDGDFIKERFPHIYETCLRAGYDITAGPVPVTPAQHYHMGGVGAGLWGETSMGGLYAIGEAGCGNLHGANRLASNSLLEALVYAKRAATSINARAAEADTAAGTGAKGPVCYDDLASESARARIVKSLLPEKIGGKNELYCC